MRYFLIATVPLLVCVCALSQVTDGAQRPGTAKSVLQETVPHYQLSDANLRDALAVLSMSSVRGLHLGFEEILRGKIMDPVDQSVRFSLHLENNTVDEILNALCQSDPRYVWSLDGLTINVYPKRSTTDSSYFMNLLIAQISFKDVTDSDHALGPLDTEFPEQQVGYMEMGGDNSYSKPWQRPRQRHGPAICEPNRGTYGLPNLMDLAGREQRENVHFSQGEDSIPLPVIDNSRNNKSPLDGGAGCVRKPGGPGLRVATFAVCANVRVHPSQCLSSRALQ